MNQPTNQVANVPQVAQHLATAKALEEYCLLPDVSKRDRLSIAYARKFLADNPNIEANFVIEFFHKIQETGANPFFGDIYCLPFQAKDGNRFVTKATVMFGYQFLQDRAMSTGEYEGYDGPIFKEHVENWNPFTGAVRETATCQVTVYRTGRRPCTYTADFWEFAKIKKDYNTGALTLQSTWNNWKIMLEKCALANALRRAFPEVLRGIYCQEEMFDARHEEMQRVSAPVLAPAPQAAPPVVAIQERKVPPKREPVMVVTPGLEDKVEPVYEPIKEAQEMPFRPSPEDVADVLPASSPCGEVKDVVPEGDGKLPESEERSLEKKRVAPKKTLDKEDRPATNDEMMKIDAVMNKAIHDGHLGYDCLGALQGVQRSYKRLYDLAMALSKKDYVAVKAVLYL